MAIELLRFASGDTDYIAKMNSDMAMIEGAINALQTAAYGTGGETVNVAAFLDALFRGTTTLIGVGSYKSVADGTTVVVDQGYCYKASTQNIVHTIGTTLSLVGQSAGTLYVVPDATGAPTISSSSTDALYSVTWSGTEVTATARIAPAAFDAAEENNSRVSATTSTTYPSLDSRLEAVETLAAHAYAHASTPRIRKVGLSLDGGGSVITTGVYGAIQVDFEGEIIGWSLIADQAGTITVEVSRATDSPAAEPPAPPPVPDPDTDKISASAPIQLLASPVGQSASGGTDEVSTWSRSISMWDTIQFRVTEATGVQRVTLYIRIQEAVD